VTADFLTEVASRLDEVGVRGAAARRVLAEVRDHLEEAGPDADPASRFGDAAEFAHAVAAELATAGTRRATFTTFAALALAGIGLVTSFALVDAAGGWPDVFAGRIDAVGPLSGLAMFLLAQVSFVCGCLALVAALRLRRPAVVGREELRLLRRRSAVALAAAAASLAALALYALNFRGQLAPWWTWVTIAGCIAVGLLLCVAAVSLARSARPVAASGGSAGDVFVDLAPVFGLPLVRSLQLPRHPWRFALVCAAVVAIVGLGGGWYAEGDPGPALALAALEGTALLVCFAALGRPLGLRR
jgi:hypothetical protein